LWTLLDEPRRGVDGLRNDARQFFLKVSYLLRF